VATEAFISFPVMGVTGAVLAVTTHFFEFLPVNKQTYQDCLSSQNYRMNWTRDKPMP